MKKLVLAASMFALASGTGLAADMAVKAAPPPLAVPSWAGFYLGIHGGYGWKDDPFSEVLAFAPPITTIDGIKARGWLAGGQAGYNWQYSAVVGGLELDVSATRLEFCQKQFKVDKAIQVGNIEDAFQELKAATNNDLPTAVEEVRTALHAARSATVRMTGLAGFVRGLGGQS